MWCGRCQQDVPGMVSVDGIRYCCPRCGEPVRTEGYWRVDEEPKAWSESEGQQEPIAEHALGPAPYDSWEFDQRLGQIGRMLQIGMADGCDPEASQQGKAARLDPSHSRNEKHLPT